MSADMNTRRRWWHDCGQEATWVYPEVTAEALWFGVTSGGDLHCDCGSASRWYRIGTAPDADDAVECYSMPVVWPTR